MTKTKSNSHFGKSGGVFGNRTGGVITCTNCGKRTRDTGHNEGTFEMCRRCIEAQETANGILDGQYTLDDVPEKDRDLVATFL